MLPVHALLFLIFQLGISAFAIPVASHSQTPVLRRPKLKFNIDPNLPEWITLYRLQTQSNADKTKEPSNQLASEPLDVLQIDRGLRIPRIEFRKLRNSVPHSLQWGFRLTNFGVPDHVKRLNGWWLMFPCLNVGDDDYGKLVHIVSDQNRFVANYIKFEPHIIGELVEVTKLSDIVGYWYLPPGVLFSGSETPERSTNLEVMVAQVVDNEQVKLWELGIDPGTLRYPRARTIHTNDNLETFEGCWIRYPLRDVSGERRREAVCIKEIGGKWKAFRGTWEVNLPV